jgi:hypothetical protein
LIVSQRRLEQYAFKTFGFNKQVLRLRVGNHACAKRMIVFRKVTMVPLRKTIMRFAHAWFPEGLLKSCKDFKKEQYAPFSLLKQKVLKA